MKHINVNGVCIYRNAIAYPFEIIEASELLNISTDSKGDWSQSTVIDTEGKVFISDVRTNQLMFTPAPTQKGDESSAEVMLANKIHECVLPCLQHFNNKFGLSIKSNSTLGYQILKYSIGEHYVSHLDNGERTRRYASAVAYLNDDYEGGELYFPNQGVQFKPKKGAAYFFPGDMNYIHGVTEIKSGIRYTCPFFWEITEHTGDRKP